MDIFSSLPNISPEKLEQLAGNILYQLDPDSISNSFHEMVEAAINQEVMNVVSNIEQDLKGWNIAIPNWSTVESQAQTTMAELNKFVASAVQSMPDNSEGIKQLREIFAGTAVDDAQLSSMFKSIKTQVQHSGGPTTSDSSSCYFNFFLLGVLLINN